MAQLTDHTRAEGLFSAYIDRHVTADEQVFVEQHEAVCAACRAQLRATRSMVAALNALPAVKAPRSFVLPKSMAVQPEPSIFKWYPALRLATVMAAAAFVLVFAGELLIMRPAGGSNVTMSAPAPTIEAPTALKQAPVAKPSPADQQPPPPPPAPTRAAPAAGSGYYSQQNFSWPEEATAQPAAQPAPTETEPADAMTAAVETTATAAPTPTVEPTPVPMVEAPATATPTPTVETPVPTTVEAPAPSLTTEVPPSIDPLRLASLVLGGLVVVLGAATLIVRRGA